MRKDAEVGMDPVVRKKQGRGMVIECPDSPCVTPLFPVKKPQGGWRLVQDLQAINKDVAVVPDPPCPPERPPA